MRTFAGRRLRNYKIEYVNTVNIKQELEALTPSLVAVRRDLHQHPEIAFEETRTSGVIADHLERAGLSVRRGVGKTGLIAEVVGELPGRTVLVRADIDALPMTEETGMAYASQTPGRMHACGHDGHASIALHVAEMFARNRADLPGTYRFVFQPAEEIVQGAKAMLRDAPDLLEGIDAAVGLHLWNDYPAGWVGVREGPSFAAPDAFTLIIHGRGGHAAAPHRAIDPIVIGAQVINALQTLVSRETNPLEASVITIATLRAGSGVHNIIPERAELLGTLRTFKAELRPLLQRRIEEVATGIARALGGDATLEWFHGPPAVVNDAALTERFRSVARGIVPEVAVSDQTMGGDDMAEFLARVPGVYFLVGSGKPDAADRAAHHHPKFDIDDTKSLPLAAELLSKAALEFARG
jgi:amidohydrolase